MRAVDIILSKRDGRTLARDEIRFFVDGVTAGTLPDYQASALLMAILLRGMTPQETAWLTDAMVHSGIRVDLREIPGAKVDKHSTGGVGDKTSLILAPLAAACGVPVPMMSGRGLGHTGGTLDKLEAIPGFRTNLSLAEAKAQVQKIGCALIGQTAEIAPADRKLYALRDVTATVPCRPLMAASIMSKKMAEGISGLVLDVKVGNGAFMKTEAEGRELAELMIQVARGLDKDCVALLTDMNQPLGRTVGNALEVIEAFEALRGKGPEDFITLCRELAAEMLVFGQAANTVDVGRAMYDELIASGAALEKMREIITAQAGEPRVLDDYSLLPTARHERKVPARRSGYVQAIDTEAIGRASMLLGAGRLRLDSKIDLSVGLTVEARIGDHVDESTPLALMHFNDAVLVDEAGAVIMQAYRIGAERTEPPALIKDVLR